MLFQFTDASGRRRTMRFDRLSKREFEQVRFRCKRMLAFQLAKEPYDRETLAWIDGLTDYLRKKLVRSGLLAAKVGTSLSSVIARFIASRQAVNPKTKKSFSKPDTIKVYNRCRNRLFEHFGEDRSVESVTKGDAWHWHRWMMTVVGENTARRQTGIAKQFFDDALNYNLIPANPFEGLPCTVLPNRDRDFFLQAEDALKVIGACPDAEWRLIVALARWGGVRVPSEVMKLKLIDVNWETNRIKITSPKTERHRGKESRIIPLFPELRPYLEEVFDAAAPGQVHFIEKNRLRSSNLRTRFEKIIGRAGLIPWPKLFQNLRSTRETELADQFPIQVVVAWIGNSEPIAKRSYLQVRDEHFEAAAAMQKRCVSPALSDAPEQSISRDSSITFSR